MQQFKIALAGALLFSISAYAQDMPVMDWGGIMQSEAVGNAAMEAVGTRLPKRGAQAPQLQMSSAQLTYVPSLTHRRINLAHFVDKTRATDPQGAAKMAQLFATTDIIGEIGKGIASYDLAVNNVADAYTIYWMNAWEASHSLTGVTETRARTQAVKQQAIRAMLAVPKLAAASDEQKQEFSEALLVQAALISNMAEQAKANPVMSQKLAAAVSKGAKVMGLDLAAFTLTDKGFAPTYTVSQRLSGTTPASSLYSGALPHDIDSIRFYGFAGGAGAGVDIRPVILFRNGVMCDCMDYAFGAADPNSFRTLHRSDYGKWRRNSVGTVEYLWDDDRTGKWGVLDQGIAKQLPAVWHTRGTFKRISSAGFGDNMTTGTNELTFTDDGRFSRGGTISSTARTEDTSVVAGGISAKRTGHYKVDGWTLVLSYDGGPVERKTIVWESDPDVIWMNGQGYVR